MIINLIMEAMKAPARKAAKKWKHAEKVMMARVIEELMIIKSRREQNQQQQQQQQRVVVEQLQGQPGGEDVPDQDPGSLIKSHAFRNEAYTDSPSR